MILYRNEGIPTGPGLHALFIGISDYPYLPGGAKSSEGGSYDLGMSQLASPALSAAKIAHWLLQAGPRLPRPLASLRMLLAPSDAERQLIRELKPESPGEREQFEAWASSSAENCNFAEAAEALEQWRADCATSRENVAWFYFGGHGLQLLPLDPVMLLSGYNRRGGSVLAEAVSFLDVLHGMEATADFRKMALQQHFIVDACRSEFRAIRDLVSERPNKPWSYKLASREKRRECATIFGTTGGKQSFGSAEGTVLSQALLRALQGEAADAELNDASKRIWTVKHYRLLKVLDELVNRIAQQLGQSQTMEPGPLNSNVLWSCTPNTPILPVSIELSPPAAHPPQTLLVQSDGPGSKPTSVDVSEHPYAVQLEAGIYSASVNFPQGHAYQSCESGYRLYAQPPWSWWHIPLSTANDSNANQVGSEPDSDVSQRGLEQS